VMDNSDISDREGGVFTGSSQFQVNRCIMNDVQGNQV
jgi:hypothetical protein